MSIELSDLEKSKILSQRLGVKDSLSYSREFIKNKLKDLVFRRTCSAECGDLVDITYHSDEITSRKLSIEEVYKLFNKEIEQYVEFRYDSFRGITTSYQIRENDPYPNRKIFFCSDTFAELEVEKLTFEFIKTKTYVPPRHGDLLCGIVADNSAEYKAWFICSEQFLRMWTCVMYDTHPSFNDLVRKSASKKYGTSGNVPESRLREIMMSGNRLATNSYRKWLLANRDDKIEPSSEEKHKRYWRYRTEKCSIRYVHLYAVIVLMCRYNEFPSPFCIPMNKDDGVKLKGWDCPTIFVDRIVRLNKRRC